MHRINYHHSCEAMGARFEVFLFGDDEEHLEAVAVAVCEEIVRLDGLLSRFDPRSEISRVNREAGGKPARPARVDRELFALLQQCEQARTLTDGYFDVTALAGGAGLALDADDGAVSFTRPEVAIDLGGVGKGYALDCGREIMRRFGVGCGLLHGGTSSVTVLGAPAEPAQPAQPAGWPIDIRHPLTGAPIARVNLKDQSFSCSAVRHPDQQKSDILNPLIGRPLDGDAACVVLAASAAEAEVFSTALLAMGRERATCYFEKNQNLDLQVGWFEPGDDLNWLIYSALHLSGKRDRIHRILKGLTG